MNRPPIFKARIPDDYVPDGRHCTFVNPMCPDDLCELRYRHAGGHLVGTMRWDEPPRTRIPRLRGDSMPRGTSKADLITEGAKRQEEEYGRGDS